jgi:hypothetical protein
MIRARLAAHPLSDDLGQALTDFEMLHASQPDILALSEALALLCSTLESHP